MKDTRVIAIAEVIGGLRSVLELQPDHRADLGQAFRATDAQIRELHSALGRVLRVCDKQARTRG